MQMFHHSGDQQLLGTQRSGSQLWRRTWTPENSDMTDRETEYADSESDDGAHSSDSEYVDSEYGDARGEAQLRASGLPTGKRAPDGPTTFVLRQKVWVNVKGVWYIGQVRQIVIDRSSMSVRLCPMYEVHFRYRMSHANMKTVADPLKGNIKPDTPQFRAWLISERCPVGSNWDI